jgi:DNA-binding FadR family transcriptional regulator
MGKLPQNDPRAPYLQVVDALTKAVIAGEYEPGAQLPSLAALAEEFDVAVGTARRALRVLADQGITTTRQGTGSFIRDDLDLNGLVVPPQFGPGVDAQLAAISLKLDQFDGRLGKLEEQLTSIVQLLQGKPANKAS